MTRQIPVVVIVTTYDTMSSDGFTELVKKPKTDKILIADEVHNAGADSYRKGLLDEYNYRLGLSATPARYLDDEGTDYLITYFDKEVFEFSLQKAINTINPDTGKTFLTPYKYCPIFVSLNVEELQEYASYSQKIVSVFSIKDPTPQDKYYLSKLLIKRAKIGKNAAQKYSKFRELIPSFHRNGVFDHCLVYCSDGKDPKDKTIKCIESIVSMLNDADITNRRFNSSDDNEERREILKHFANGDTSTLVAIKCLDEGVDVPSTKNAIILASTGNPREYIQRRGRILRHSEGKDFALLLDFMIVPGNIPGYHETENQIFNVEYRRFKEFSSLSLNKEENEKIINEIIQNNHITIQSEDIQWFRL
jgi:superfamily II DNA or RNA helicase